MTVIVNGSNKNYKKLKIIDWKQVKKKYLIFKIKKKVQNVNLLVKTNNYYLNHFIIINSFEFYLLLKNIQIKIIN